MMNPEISTPYIINEIKERQDVEYFWRVTPRPQSIHISTVSFFCLIMPTIPKFKSCFLEVFLLYFVYRERNQN